MFKNVTYYLMYSFYYSVSLRILYCNWFTFNTVVVNLHVSKGMSYEFTASIISDLRWPRISGKPFLFHDIGYSN
jgi:hypothetical protein